MASVHDWSIDSGMTSPNRWRRAFRKDRWLICFTAKFFFPYLLCDSRLPDDEFQNQNSEFAQGERRGNWVEVRDQWEWPTSSEISQATGNEERQQKGKRIYLQQVNKKMKAESNSCDKLKKFLKEWEREEWNSTMQKVVCVYLVYLEKQHWECEPKLLLQRLNWEGYHDLNSRW